MNTKNVHVATPLETSDPKMIDEICRFRAQVWKQTGHFAPDAFPNGCWRDPIDSEARHWLTRLISGRLVAAGRLSIHETLDDVHQAEEYKRYGVDAPGPIAAPDRVVVCPSVQGRGMGRQILDVQDEAMRVAGARYAVRQASHQMIRLLEHRGWQLLGPASPDERFPGAEFMVAILVLEARVGPTAR